jgi:hypothetical protein
VRGTVIREETYDHTLTRGAGFGRNADALNERTETSFLSLVHIACLAEENPRFIAADAEFALQDRGFKQKASLRKRAVAREQVLGSLQGVL